MPLTSCLQGQGLMPAAGGGVREEPIGPQQQLTPAVRTGRQRRSLGPQDSSSDVSVILVAATVVKGKQKYLVQKTLTGYMALAGTQRTKTSLKGACLFPGGCRGPGRLGRD